MTQRRLVIRRKKSRSGSYQEPPIVNTTETSLQLKETKDHDHILQIQQTLGNQFLLQHIQGQSSGKSVQRSGFSLSQFKMATEEVKDNAPDGHGKGCGCAGCSGGRIDRIPIQRTPKFTTDAVETATQEVQDDALYGHGKGCGCVGCSGGRIDRLSIQRMSLIKVEQTTPPQHAQAKPMIQRDILTKWQTRSQAKWTTGRSSELQAIDVAVKAYVDASLHTMASAWSRRLEFLPVILDAIAGWKASKISKTLLDKSVKRMSAVTELERVAKEHLADAQRRKKEYDDYKEAAMPAYETWMELSGGMDEYAKRSMFTSMGTKDDASKFHPDDITDRIKALTMERNPDGSLSDEAIRISDAEDTKSLKDKNLDIGSKATMTADPSLTKEQIEELKGKHINPVTGETKYPELNNLLEEGTGESDEEVTETRDLGGISFQVTYNKSDVNFEARLEMLRQAVEKIQSAGFTPPSLQVYLPKMGRSLSIDGECVIKEGPKKSERAVYVAPNFMHISSENMFNPLTDKKSGSPDEFKFSSTAFDPSGVGTIIHEFGHAMHRDHAGGKFHELYGTAFQTIEQVSLASEEVSEYGTKPREFVAEVFLGLVYGKRYSDDVMRMYHAFGGAPKS